MAGEIAQAFVRIRPNMAGFKAETETGVTSAFSGAFRKAATLVGIGFGVKAGFDFGKSIIGDAANVQKSVEAIRAGFGSASKQVLDFADKAGLGFGIATHQADATSARFAILFKNLGIGQTQAAGMTVGLEKLAGSLSAIRGVDPAAVLDRLPLALAGNLRSLKQLGLAVDASQIKLAALKLGLISTTKDALTPGIKAQAIYALATANLGSFQAQALKHAGDYVNVQRRLSAEWDRAKEILGTALLPAFTRLVTSLDHWFERMSRSGALQRDFNAAGRTTATILGTLAHAVQTGFHAFEDATRLVGGTKRALEIFLAVIAVRKIIAISTAIRTQLIANGFRVLQVTVAETQGEYIAAFGSMEIATIGLSATIKAALISTGIGAIAVAAGIAAVEIINHFATVKRWFVEFGNWIATHWRLLFFVPIVGEVVALVAFFVENFGEIKRTVVAFADFFSTVFVHPIRAVENLFRSLVGVIEGVFHNVEKEALQSALQIVEPFSHLPGFLGGGKFRSIKDWIKGQLDDLTHYAVPQAKASAQAVANAYSDNPRLSAALARAQESTLKKVKDAHKKVKDLLGGDGGAGSAGFQVIPLKIQLELAQARTPAAQRKALLDELSALNREIAGHLALQTRVQVEQEKSSVLGQLKDLASQAKQTATTVGQSIDSVVQTAHQRIVTSVESAKKNLDSIGSKLADSINRILDKLGATGKGIAGSPQAAAFKKLRDLISGGASSIEVERAAQQLSSSIAARASGTATSSLSDRRAQVKASIANLTDEFNRGVISLAQFNRKVADVLKKDGVSYKIAGKTLGVSFVDGFKAEVKGLHEQAAAIAALPANLRRTGGGGGAADIRIIRPLETIRTENQRIATAASRQRERQIRAAEKTATATAKTATAIKTLGKVKVGMLPGEKAHKARTAAAAGIRP